MNWKPAALGVAAAVANTLLLAVIATAFGPGAGLGSRPLIAALSLAALSRFVDGTRHASALRIEGLGVEACPSVWSLATGLGVFAVDVVALIDPNRSANVVVFAAGLAAMMTGVGLRWAAIRGLAHRFRDDGRIDGDLERRGIYGFVRHPAEIGLQLVTLGMAATLGSGSAAVCWLLIVLTSTIRRIGDEESRMQRVYGAGYEAYCLTTPRLLPWTRGHHPSPCRH